MYVIIYRAQYTILIVENRRKTQTVIGNKNNNIPHNNLYQYSINRD